MSNPQENPPVVERKQEAQNDTSTAPQESPVVKPDIKAPIPAQPVSQQQLQTAEEKIGERMTAFERSMIRLTRAGVIVGVITLLIFVGQLYEMIEGGTQTDKIVTASQNIQVALKLANQQNLDAVKKTLAQSQVATDASNAQSKTALDATISQNRLDQRAFINFGKVMQDNPIIIPGHTDVQGWEFRPHIGNSGDTPTRNARTHASFRYLPTILPADFTFSDIGQEGPDTPFMLGPKEDATGPNLTVPFAVMEDVKAKTIHLYVYGWLTYQDIFPKTPMHISMFCMELADIRGQLVPGTGYQFLWTLCPRHNCGDDECRGEPFGTPTKTWQ